MYGYGEPYRMAAIRAIGDRTGATALLGLHTEEIDYDHRDVAAQKALLRERLGQMSWEPWLFDRMDEAGDFYFDSCSQVVMPAWSWRRVALLGDAAYCSSPASGQGTSLSIVGAHVLAGELAAADGDHRTAFERYERTLRGFVAANQKMGRDGANKMRITSERQQRLTYLAVRLLPYLPGKKLFMRRILRTLNALDLPDYSRLPVATA